jgi:hypothetical protein
MKIYILLFYIVTFAFSAFCDESDDLYLWIKNKKAHDSVEKLEKFRKDNKSSLFFSGDIYLAFFYCPDIWQGTKNEHIGNFGYQTRDFRDSKYHKDNNDGTLVKNPWGGVQTGFMGNFNISRTFIDSDIPIFKQNKIQIQFDWTFEWMQGDCGIKFIFQPVGFYYTSLGINIGSGWNFLSDNSGKPFISGLGLNTKDGFISTPFLGPVLTVDYQNTLQINFSVLPFIPKNIKRWTNIVMSASAIINYKALLTIDQNQPFYYQNQTSDIIFGGWNFAAEFLAGYIIPVIEDKTTFQSFRKQFNNRFSIMPAFKTKINFSLTHYNDSPMKDGWGSDFVTVELNPLLVFNLPCNYKIILSFNFKNDKRFTEDTIGNAYIKDKLYEDWYLEFKKVGIIFGWEF